MKRRLYGVVCAVALLWGLQALRPGAVAFADDGGGDGDGGSSGKITGMVADSMGGMPFEHAQITAFSVSAPGVSVRRTETEEDGRYSLSLPPGMYLLEAEAESGMNLIVTQWFDHASDEAHATPVSVRLDSTSTANFTLGKPGPVPMATISGTVWDTTGKALSMATVVVQRSVQEMELRSSSGDSTGNNRDEDGEIGDMGRGEGIVWKGMTDSTGRYSASVASGHSYIVLSVKQGFRPQFFNHESDPMMADVLMLDHDTAGINFNLIPLPVIPQFAVKGSVKDSSGMGVPSRIVFIPLHKSSDDEDARTFGFTDSTGNFSVSHVTEGRYFLLAVPFKDFAPAYFARGMFGVRHWQHADTVDVMSDTSGFDIGVIKFQGKGMAHIEGHVRHGDQDDAGANVFAEDAAGSIVGYGLSDGLGQYAISGLPFGSVTVIADQISFTSSSSSVSLSPVTLSVGSVDLALSPATITSVSAPAALTPSSFALRQNYPNPFNPSTRIVYAVPNAAFVSLKVYNILGQVVATLVEGGVDQGQHQVVWDGRDDAGKAVASGMYFYRLSATPASGGKVFQSMKKMLLIR